MLLIFGVEYLAFGSLCCAPGILPAWSSCHRCPSRSGTPSIAHTNFFIFNDAQLHHHRHVVPAADELLAVGFVEAGEAVGDLLGDVAGQLAHRSIHLQIASGDVERDIWAVDDAAQHHQIFRDHIFALIGDEDPVTVELDRILAHVEVALDLGEVEDPLQVKG